MAELYCRDQMTLAAVEKLRFFPLAATSGDGCWLIEDSGRRLLDLSATWAAASLGHGHPGFTAAVTAALTSPPGAGMGSIANATAVELAEALLARTPGPDRRVYLGHSGSDANEAAVRAVLRHSPRRGIVAFHGSYHGGLLGSSAFSGLIVDSGQPAAAELTLIDYPGPNRDPDSVSVSASRALDALDAALADEPAVLLIEPIMSDGGLLVPPAGFLAEVIRRCRAAGTLVLCDEVKVGIGRTGSFYAHEGDGLVDDLTPDIVTLGKGLGNGLPISAAIGPAAIMDVAEASSMLTTAGNPVCSAAALAVLRTLDSEQLMDNAATIGAALLSGLRDIAARRVLVGDVRGRGLAIGIEIVEADGTPAVGTTAKIVMRAWQLGAVVFYVGRRSNVLELTPPLILTIDEARLALHILDAALADVEAGRVSDADIADYAGW